MNRDLNTFQENIKEWVKLDTAIREINNKGKNLRDQRSNLEQNITDYVSDNSLESTTIRVQDATSQGRLQFQMQKTTPPLTMKYVSECLHNVLQDENTVDTIMEYIRTHRNHKVEMGIKRYYD